jgi:hypothetical protein
VARRARSGAAAVTALGGCDDDDDDDDDADDDDDDDDDVKSCENEGEGEGNREEAEEEADELEAKDDDEKGGGGDEDGCAGLEACSWSSLPSKNLFWPSRSVNRAPTSSMKRDILSSKDASRCSRKETTALCPCPCPCP